MSFLMEIYEGVAISWQAIWANKLRSILTTLGIIIGIVTVTLMGTAIEGLNQAFLKSISALGADVLYIQKQAWFSQDEWWKTRNRRDITLANVRAVTRQSTHAFAISPQSETFRTVTYHDLSASGVWVVGNNEDGAIARGLVVKEGRYFTTGEVNGERPVCVLGAELATRLFPHGSSLGKVIRIGQNNYTVVGVVDKMGQLFFGFNFDNQVIVPISRFMTDFGWRPSVTVIVKVKDMAQMDEAREELRGIMRRLRRLEPGQTDDFAINQQEVIVKTFERVTTMIASVGLFITGLSLFVGGIGIMNIMFVSVAERTREIGVRKAIGARQRTILLQFLIEAASICLFGGLVAITIAWLITLAVSTVLPTSMSATVIGLALLVAAATGVVSGFFPAWRAARMDPVEALRHE